MTIAAPVAMWEPDDAALDGGGTIEALNVVPKKRGYGPFQQFQAISTVGLTSRAQGSFFARKTDNSIVIFTGDATKLYKLIGATWSNISRSTGGPYNCAPDGRWSFVQFGPNVLAFNGYDTPQTINIDSGTNFADLAGGPPTATYAAVVGDFIVTGNQAANRSLVQWSAINNSADWVTSQQTQADNQPLPDGGPIQAVFGHNYSAIILQEFGIKIGTYEGPPLIFRFSKIAEGLGCSIPGSAAQYLDWCFFYSYSGLYMLQAASQLTPIGDQRVNDWLRVNINQNFLYRCCSGIDPLKGIYVLGFPDQTSSGPVNHFLIYNYVLNQFSHVQAGNFDLIQSGSGVTRTIWTIEDLAAAYGTIENIPYPLDSPFWSGSVTSWLSGFDTSHQSGFFQGPPLAATVTSGELNLVNGKKAFVRGIRPLVEGASPPVISIALGTRDLQTNQIVYGSAVPMDQFGYCRFRSKGRYHSAQIQLAAGGTWDHVLGITDPLFVPFGTR